MSCEEQKRVLRVGQGLVTAASSAIVVIYASVSGPIPDVLAYVYISILLLKYATTGYVRSFELALSVSLIALFVVPTALSVVFSEAEFVPFLAVTQLFASGLQTSSNILNRSIGGARRLDKDFQWVLWLGLLTIVVIGWNIRLGLDSIANVIVFFAPFAASLVVVERSIDRLSTKMLYGILFVYLLLVFYYAMYFWSGFGRLVISAYVLVPILLINQHRDIGLRVWHIAILTPFVLVGAFLIRFQEKGYSRLMEDSWVSHLTLTHEMSETLTYRRPPGFGDYLEQYLLLFFQWVPRSIWPTKPVGVGLSFVDDWIGRQGFDAGHSVALGYIGETIWYLGPWFFVGIIVIFVTILFLRYIAAFLASGSYVLLSTVDGFMPSFFWGGMASYGARFWFFFIPGLLTIFLFRLRFKESGQIE